MCHGEPLVEMGFGLADLSRVRELVVATAVDADLPRERADELALAVNEIATNAILHGRPPTTLRIWRQHDQIVCEVADAGAGIKDQLAGQVRPPADAVGGRGLWLARQLCDALEIRNGVGCTVSLHATIPVAATVAAG
jgi:anti-sigma regulatory factor (Ser/Thr protein kinase)